MSMGALRRRRFVHAGSNISAQGIAAQALRWDSGSGSTVLEIVVPLQQGQLLPANLAGVSVWVGGTERAVFLTTRGLWPDNSARVLYGKCTLTMTNGSPLAADVRLTGGFTVSRVADTDMSSRWSTTAGATAWHLNGFPAGAIVPTSTAHLCAASWLGPLVPQATEPTWTGSAAVLTAWDETLITNPLAWPSSQAAATTVGAYYERGSTFAKKWMRTGDATYLRYALSAMARWYGDYWTGSGDSLPEQMYCMQDYSCVYLLRNDDTPWTTWIRPKAEGDGGSGNFSMNDPATIAVALFSNPGIYNARRYSGIPISLAWFGIVCGFGDRVVSGETWKQNADLWLGQLDVGAFWDASKSWTLEGFESNGTTPKRVVVLYMVAVLSSRILRLCEVLPSSTNVTKAKNLIRTSCDWLRVNSGLLVSSPVAYPYATGEIFNSSGATVYGAGTGPEVDLSALFSHMFAWKGYADNSAADIAHAKLLYASTGLTPRNGGAGPYIGEHSTSAKQWDEAFYLSQNVPAYVSLYEAL